MTGESIPTPEKKKEFRILQKEYIYDTSSAQGEIYDGSQKEGRTHVLWTGEAGSVDDLTLDAINRPYGDYDENDGPHEGNCDYLYELQEKRNGKWETIQTLSSDTKRAEGKD